MGQNNRSQFDFYVEQATEEVYEKGLKATPQAITMYCFGQLDKRQRARVIRLDGKLMGALLVVLGAAAGNIINRITRG